MFVLCTKEKYIVNYHHPLDAPQLNCNVLIFGVNVLDSYYPNAIPSHASVNKEEFCKLTHFT